MKWTPFLTIFKVSIVLLYFKLLYIELDLYFAIVQKKQKKNVSTNSLFKCLQETAHQSNYFASYPLYKIFAQNRKTKYLQRVLQS